MKSIPSALMVAVGIAAAGWLVGEGFRAGRATDRYVTVKGVAERAVEADTAVWPLTVVVSGDALDAVHGELGVSVAAVRAFLERSGVPADQVQLQGFSVVDKLADRYGPAQRSGNRFIINQKYCFRSAKIRQINLGGRPVIGRDHIRHREKHRNG